MGNSRALVQLTILAMCSVQAQVATAQEQTSASLNGQSGGDDVPLGDSPDALPGLVRIGVVGLEAPRASAALHALYGFTEPQNGASDAHHRIGTSAAIAIAPWSFASVGLRADFRHDIHGSDALGGDSGSVLDFTPILRLGTMLPSKLHLGVEGRVRLPGASDGAGGISPEIDARALAAYSGISTWVLALHAGYRLGIGGGVVEDSANMRPGDRIALGLSEFDAILLGFGALKSLGNTEVFGEVTSDMLIGSGAPGFAQSPLRISAGVRHPLLERLWLSAVVEGTPMNRAPSLPGDPLVPIEPRVQGMLGLVWRFVAPKKPVTTEPLVEEKVTKEEVKEQPKEEEGPPPVVTSSVRVTVIDHTGHPISDAKVSVDVPKRANSEAQSMAVPLESTNTYALDGIPVGEVEVVVTAELLKPHTESVLIQEGSVAEVEVKLLPAATVGSQLRGLVRSYAGKGIAASVTVEPGGHTAKCDEEGSFELDLPPGVYKVIIEAEGYRSQNRTLRVRTEGVTVLNADLQEAVP